MTAHERALRDIVNVLGPETAVVCSENGCQGCQFEMAEALHIARVALGLEELRWGEPVRRTS